MNPGPRCPVLGAWLGACVYTPYRLECGKATMPYFGSTTLTTTAVSPRVSWKRKSSNDEESGSSAELRRDPHFMLWEKGRCVERIVFQKIRFRRFPRVMLPNVPPLCTKYEGCMGPTIITTNNNSTGRSRMCFYVFLIWFLFLI